MKWGRWILLSFSVTLMIACKQRYDPPVSNPPTGYLVVEGVINSGTGSTNIHLSRTTTLRDTAKIKNELHAQVSVEGENNGSFLLTEKGQGLYSIGQLALLPNQKYRLHIRTTDGKDYVSDYTAAKRTPPIDTITWQRSNGGVQLYLDTHDPQNNTKYYRWEYEQTWEFHSPYTSIFQYIKNGADIITGVAYRYPATHDFERKIFYCWQFENSRTILLGSSAKLAMDTIHSPLAFIAPGSEKLSVLFSINVRQYAVSAEGYDFFSRMKKNTEETGSLFDPQPSALNGNIHCTTNPAEIVVGFVDVADAQEKRVFIYNRSFPDWNFPLDTVLCRISSVGVHDTKQLEQQFYTIPTDVDVEDGSGVLSVHVANQICVDCTFRGTNVKPSYWP